jgi:hypothetical protein
MKLKLKSTQYASGFMILTTKTCFPDWEWWFTLVIPGTWEEEVGEIAVRGQPEQKQKTLI